MLLKTKLTNQLNKLAKEWGVELEVHLKNITVNGEKRGCSGHVVNLSTGSCVYVNTEGSCYAPLSGKSMYRLAKDINDYSSNSLRNGYNRWTNDVDFARVVFILTMIEKAEARE